MVTPFALVVVAYAIQLALTARRGWRRAPRRACRSRAPARGARARVALRDEQLRLPDGVRDRPRRTPRLGARGTGPVAAGARHGARLDRRRRSLLYLPFWRASRPPTSGVGRIREHTLLQPLRARLRLIYGSSLWVVLALFAGRFRDAAALPRVGGRRCPLRPRPARAAAARGPHGRARRSPRLAVFVTFASGSAEPAVPRRCGCSRRSRSVSARERRGRVPARRLRRHARASASTRSSRPATRHGSCSRSSRGVGVFWSAGGSRRGCGPSGSWGSAALVALGARLSASRLVLANRIASRTTRRSTACAGSSAPRRRRGRDRLAPQRRSDGAPTLARDGGSRLRPRRPRPRLDVHRPSRGDGHGPGTRCSGATTRGPASPTCRRSTRRATWTSRARLLGRYGVRYVVRRRARAARQPRRSARRSSTRLGTPAFRSGSDGRLRLPADRLEAATDGDPVDPRRRDWRTRSSSTSLRPAPTSPCPLGSTRARAARPRHTTPRSVRGSR